MRDLRPLSLPQDSCFSAWQQVPQTLFLSVFLEQSWSRLTLLGKEEVINVVFCPVPAGTCSLILSLYCVLMVLDRSSAHQGHLLLLIPPGLLLELWFFIVGRLSLRSCISKSILFKALLPTVSNLRHDFHHIKVDFKKSEVVQPLVCIRSVLQQTTKDFHSRIGMFESFQQSTDSRIICLGAWLHFLWVYNVTV